MKRATKNIYVTTVVAGGVAARLRSALSAQPNWGVALDANETDYDSTNATQHGDQAVSSTGWKSWELSVVSLPIGAGQVWFRFADLTEGEQTTKNFAYASQNHGTPSLRPYIRVWEEAGGVGRCLKGCGP